MFLKITQKVISKIVYISKKIWNTRPDLEGLVKNPFFGFGAGSIFLLLMIFLGCGSSVNFSLAQVRQATLTNSFFDNNSDFTGEAVFFSQDDGSPLQTPDLKIVQDNCVCGISTPRVLTPKVLGDVLGGPSKERKDVTEYRVQPGDTLQSIAKAYEISVNTLLWANDMTSSSQIKLGQTLIVLPTDGVLHIVKSGDTVDAIAQKYKTKLEDVVLYNSLASQDDIYIGDILIVPGGTLPKKASPLLNIQAPLADNFFILPTSGRITQGLHFYNAVDVANKCGTSVYAAASGIVERAVFNNSWNGGMGNYVTVLHSNGIVTYYGHLQNVFVKSGDKVNVGDRIGLMGQTGNATGCHVHFEVVGAQNPLSRYALGANISLK